MLSAGSDSLGADSFGGYDASVYDECVLCQHDLRPVVRQTKHWQTVVNHEQDILGKLFVALRRHEEDVADLTADEWADLRDEVRWATDRLRIAFEPDHFNYSFLMNAVAHVHLHVIPRYVGTRVLEGIVFSDSAYPHQYRQPRAPGDVVSADIIGAVAAAIAD
jgi:diadenosine tetraphosphate (Ap4A) HIT family hydrolase